jgi:2-polyprenyl-6-methoxyphenol hydroxylase-like FAD-dependent oxidoreductase
MMNTATHSVAGKRAVVIGAGISGMSAARALADSFTEVVLIERDILPDVPAPRPGVPQGKHPHGLLGAGTVALNSLFPDFTQDLVRAGAASFDTGRDMLLEFPGIDSFPRKEFGWLNYGVSRPVLEACVLQRLKRHPNVRVLMGCQVLGINGSPDGSAVTGVRYESGNGSAEAISADLIVDASGQGSFTLNFLRSSGRPLPEETKIGIDIRYSSAVFAMSDRVLDFKAIVTFPKPPEDVRAGYLLPAENRHWQMLLIGRGDDIPPFEEQAFLSYAEQLRTTSIYRVIKETNRLTEVARAGFPESIWRHYGKLQDFPKGLLPLGDAICRLNPVWGQGMATALKESQLLHQLSTTQLHGDDSIDVLTQAFLKEAESMIADPWELSTTADFAYPATRGQQPEDWEDKLRFQGALLRICSRDPEVNKLVGEVRNLLKPLSVLSEPEIKSRIEAELEQEQPA